MIEFLIYLGFAGVVFAVLLLAIESIVSSLPDEDK